MELINVLTGGGIMFFGLMTGWTMCNAAHKKVAKLSNENK